MNRSGCNSVSDEVGSSNYSNNSNAINNGYVPSTLQSSHKLSSDGGVGIGGRAVSYNNHDHDHHHDNPRMFDAEARAHGSADSDRRMNNNATEAARPSVQQQVIYRSYFERDEEHLSDEFR